MNRAPKPLRWNSVEQLVVEALAGDLVEGAERLVEQEHRRVHHQRAGQRGAHPHAAGELLGVLRLEARRARRARSPRRPGPRGPPSAPCPARRTARRCAAPCATAAAWRPGTRSRGSVRSTVTVPASGASSPEAIRSSVDLPQPDGPTTVTNSPGATSNDVGARARVPSGNVLATPSNTSVGAGRPAWPGGSIASGSGSGIGHHGSASVHDHPAGDVHRLAGAVVGVVDARNRAIAGDVGCARRSGRAATSRSTPPTISGVRVAAPISVST